MNSNWTIPGHDDHYIGVRATGVVTQQPWQKSLPVCPLLETRGILHIGIAQTSIPFREETTNSKQHLLLVCLAGEGRVLLDETWMPCTKDMAFFLPAGTHYALRAHGSWRFCWVHVRENALLLGKSRPQSRFGAFPAKRMSDDIEALTVRAAKCRRSSTETGRLDGISTQIMQFLDRDPADAIARAWQAVSRVPERKWTMDELCLQAGCNKRKLREWALRSFGRPPMRQIFHLRLVRACQELLSSSRSEEQIAHDAGFPSLESFRIAFVKWTGQDPAIYRMR